MKSFEATAFVIDDLLNRKQSNISVIHEEVILQISGRERLTGEFIDRLKNWLLIQYNCVLVELENNLFGAIHLRVLNDSKVMLKGELDMV